MLMVVMMGAYGVNYKKPKTEATQARQLISGKYIDGKSTSKQSGALQGSKGAYNGNPALKGFAKERKVLMIS